jgi:UDP-N-acetylglucosamine--N-acetylmuramyl-(pentapeptide) pyrophosphoryl-undecaprenol N-acetylglucosamine transferase
MFPACALFKVMRQRGHDSIIITDVRGNAFCEDVHEKIVLDTIRFSQKNLMKIGYYSALALVKFFKFWLKRRPEVVIGFGGIFTVIPLVISKFLGSKVVIYEQNSVIGKANKFLEKFADLKLASFKLDESWTKVSAPVRDEFIKKVPYECAGVVKILVIGGSQGAASFSRLIPEAIKVLNSRERNNVEIVQQVEHKNIAELSKTYKDLGIRATLKNFLHDVAEVMLRSQLVVCRSGASTLSELFATGRPAILIPYPASSDNHQFHNAMYCKNKKAAWVLEENNETSMKLGKILQQILQNRELLKTASSHMMDSSVSSATDNFVRLIELI